MADRSEAVKSLIRMSNKIKREIEKSPVIREISEAEARTLYFLLDRKEPTFQRDIEEEYCMRPPSVSRLLSKMEADGLITRAQIESDGRFRRIEVTEKGRAYEDQVLRRLRNLEDVVTKGVTDEEIEEFCRVMSKISANLP